MIKRLKKVWNLLSFAILNLAAMIIFVLIVFPFIFDLLFLIIYFLVWIFTGKNISFSLCKLWIKEIKWGYEYNEPITDLEI